MHPHGFGHGFGHFGYRRGPSRFLWFVLGGITASWWICRRDAHANGGGSGWGCTWHHRREIKTPWDERSTPSNGSEAERAPQPALVPGSYVPKVEAAARREEAPVRREEAARDIDWEAVKRERWSAQAEERARSAAADRWEEDKDRLRQFAQDADEKMTEFSEATLDSVLSTVQTLKAKLAERRAQQQEQKAREEKIAEEVRRSSPRWV